MRTILVVLFLQCFSPLLAQTPSWVALQTPMWQTANLIASGPLQVQYCSGEPTVCIDPSSPIIGPVSLAVYASGVFAKGTNVAGFLRVARQATAILYTVTTYYPTRTSAAITVPVLEGPRTTTGTCTITEDPTTGLPTIIFTPI